GSAVALPGGDPLIGSPTTAVDGHLSAGAAYLFRADTGALLHALRAPRPATAQNLAQAVGAAGARPPGGAAPPTVAGEEHGGAAYLFAPDGSVERSFQEPQPARENLFGFAVAGDAASVLIGAPHAKHGSLDHAGAAYLFDASSGALRRTLRE